MELELEVLFFLLCSLLNYIIPIWNWSLSPSLALHQSFVYYIIPIWNWSSCTVFSPSCSFPITLFLYGIGATIFYCFINVYNIELHYSYMELEQINLPCNPSSKSITLFLYGIGAYIFIIDNWHLFTITLFLYGIGAWIEWIKLLEEIIYYIIPIWNWSK